VSETGTLDGVNWRFGFSTGGGQDAVQLAKVAIARGSQLGGYWPSIIFHDSSGALKETIYNHSIHSFVGPLTVGPSSTLGSPILVLPLEPNHSAGRTNAAYSSIRIIYRGTDGRLMAFDRDADGTQVSSSGALPATPEGGSSIGGFAVTRPGSSGKLNSYILYQSDDGIIRFMYQNDDAGWNGPFFDPVFDGADNPTKIACCTGAAMGDPAIPLSSTSSLSYCFFQAGRKLKHVHFDGSRWTDKGFVAIP
jgi:hypothetical protein